jgi:hypothetical protein
MEKNIKKRVCRLAAVLSAVLVVFLIFCHILVFAVKKVPENLVVILIITTFAEGYSTSSYSELGISLVK